MRVVTWNMNHIRRSRERRAEAWRYLREELKADLALVQEAVPPKASECVYRPIHETQPQWKWGSAVVAFGPGVGLRPRKRLPLDLCARMKPVAADALPDSHPGLCAVTDVVDTTGKVRLTAISLYGQWELSPGGKDKDAAPRLHRMLSDLTGVFKSRKTPIVIGGDWNISTQWHESRDNEAEAVFVRLRAWRMVDCIAHTRHTRKRLSNCKCPDGDACAHVHTHWNDRRSGGGRTQFDYMFVSERLLPKLECRVVQDDAAWALSDHWPILIDIDLS